MPTPIERQSTNISLENRYASSKVGGSFDAKSAGKVFVDSMKNEFADGFTRSGENTNFPKKESSLAKGLNTTKYKG
jgi:hypothetical protein